MKTLTSPDSNLAKEIWSGEEYVPVINISGVAATALDAVDAVYTFIPYMLMGTSIVVLVLMSFAFTSIVVSLRAVVTVTVALSIVYAGAMFVYVRGALVRKLSLCEKCLAFNDLLPTICVFYG